MSQQSSNGIVKILVEAAQGREHGSCVPRLKPGHFDLLIEAHRLMSKCMSDNVRLAPIPRIGQQKGVAA